MPKLMVLHGLPRAGAYRQPPGRLVSLGAVRGMSGASIRGAFAGARLMGLRGVAEDRSAALASAAHVRDGCKAACNFITTRDATVRAREIAQCQAGCDAAYSAAAAAITASMRDPTPAEDPTDPVADEFRRRLDEIEAMTGGGGGSYTQAPIVVEEEKILGMPKNVAYAVGGGVALLGIGYLLFGRK